MCLERSGGQRLQQRYGRGGQRRLVRLRLLSGGAGVRRPLLGLGRRGTVRAPCPYVRPVAVPRRVVGRSRCGSRAHPTGWSGHSGGDTPGRRVTLRVAPLRLRIRLIARVLLPPTPQGGFERPGEVRLGRGARLHIRRRLLPGAVERLVARGLGDRVHPGVRALVGRRGLTHLFPFGVVRKSRMFKAEVADDGGAQL